jgi:hypothetical protein
LKYLRKECIGLFIYKSYDENDYSVEGCHSQHLCKEQYPSCAWQSEILAKLSGTNTAYSTIKVNIRHTINKLERVVQLPRLTSSSVVFTEFAECASHLMAVRNIYQISIEKRQIMYLLWIGSTGREDFIKMYLKNKLDVTSI